MKKLFILLMFLFLPAIVAAENVTARYYIPPAQFNAALQIMDLGFSNVFGLFRNATGSFEYDETAKSVSELKLAIDATSLMANNPDNERELESLFTATQYPEISFVAKDS